MSHGTSGGEPRAGPHGGDDGELLDGTYRLERELSRGGMGRVHLATHVHLGTRVAIKLLHDEPIVADGASQSDRSRDDHERFRQEARAAAALRHPNVVQVLDFGVDRGRPYLVMELLDGETLRARLERDGALDAAATRAIVDGLAAALTAAHAAGVVHRDLKPDNVFLAGDAAAPVVKVLDFGVAKLDATASVVSTVSGAVMGTPAYMSPEQTQGTRDVDAASDRWALGVIAYECLLGHRPFDAEALGELVLQICAWPPPVPSEHGAVPAGFDAWFATACARDRADRFASADEQAAALTRSCAPDGDGDADTAATAAARRRRPAPTPPRSGADDELARTLPAPTRPARAPSRRWSRFAIAVAALGVLMVALWSGWRLLHPAATPRAPVRIAVLPRDDTTPPDLALVADTVTHELIHGLAAQPGIAVKARASVMRLRGQPRGDLARTAATLGVDRLLIADVTRSAGRVHMSLELIGADQLVAWTQPYDSAETELEGLCRQAASDLAVELGAPPPPPRSSHDDAAFRAYHLGRDYWARRDAASLREAIRYFDEALRLEPTYAEAWVGLVDTHLFLPWMDPTMSRPRAFQRAGDALLHALALAPGSSAVQAAYGNYLLEADWNIGGAIAAYRRAIELDRGNADARQWLGEALATSGRLDESLAELAHARQLEPLTPSILKMIGRTLYLAGRYQEAVKADDAALALEPTLPFTSYTKGYALVRLGRFDEGLAAIKADPMLQLAGVEDIVKVQELWVASRRGDRATVDRLHANLERSPLADHSPFAAGFAAAVVGDRDRMLDHLERAFAVHDPWLLQIAIIPEFDPYRREPRFAALIDRFQM